jgi:hypothetical protein
LAIVGGDQVFSFCLLVPLKVMRLQCFPRKNARLNFRKSDCLSFAEHPGFSGRQD